MTQRLPTYFISHGGGPWPWMPEMRHMLKKLDDSLAETPRQLGQTPKAILMVTAHWEERAFTLGTNPNPGMVYDYGGFPPETYEIVYPAPGAPELALRVQDLLTQAGLPVALDPKRGYDHGTFVPLAVMYPEANVPVLQMSLKTGLDPAEHIAMGRALAPLRDEGVLILGSGLSYHNLRNFGQGGAAPSQAFDVWLQAAMASAPEQRENALLHWEDAPAARICHPREEHLLPLMVTAGAAMGDQAAVVYHQTDIFGGVTASSFRFGGAAA